MSKIKYNKKPIETELALCQSILKGFEIFKKKGLKNPDIDESISRLKDKERLCFLELAVADLQEKCK